MSDGTGSRKIESQHAGVRNVIRLPDRFAFLRGNCTRILLWPAACGVAAALLWGFALARIEADRGAIEQAALETASNLARAYAEHLKRSIAQIDQVTTLVKYEWEQGQGHLKLENLEASGLFPESDLLFVLIAGRDGRIRTATGPVRIDASLSDRPAFAFHKVNDSTSLRIGQPIHGRFADRTVIHFSRRLDGVDHSFGGVVVVSVDPSHFTAFYDATGVGQAGLLGMVGTDSVPRAIRNGGEGSRAEPAALWGAEFLRETDQGTRYMDGTAEFIDGRSRFVAWRAVSSHPLIAVVGLDGDEVMAPFLQHRATTIKALLLGTLGLACFAALSMGLTARLAWRKYQEEQVRDAYRMATEGGSEGFYMLRVLRDRRNQVIDFEVADCNQRGAGLSGLTRTELVGKRFSGLYREPYLAEVMQTFRDALESGLHEDDFEVPDGSPLEANWVHRKIVRSGSGLALTLRDISETKAQERALSRLANEDPVTRLANRNWLMEFLPGAIERARHQGEFLGLLFIDLDDFKNVNDTLGHAAGDEVLQAVARRLHSLVRPSDHVVRIGGDEFTIILEPLADAAQASRVADRISESIAQPFEIARGCSTLSASIGISLYPRDGADIETLLKSSDIAMYHAKAEGKGQHRFYEPGLLERLTQRLDAEQALVRALKEDQFIVHYQPRVDAASRRLTALEALVRWQHPERGLVAPGEFVPLAEETGLVVPLGEAVINKVCAQVAAWRAAGLPVVPVSINVSSRQFAAGSVAAVIDASLTLHQLPSALIEVEITESSMMGEQTEVAANLAALRARGIRLLVDDFGTGYSSLSQLQRLDVDGLKIDRSFVVEIGVTRESEVFVSAIVSMAHALGMVVTAEGVETETQMRILEALGCNEVQGFLIARPAPAERIVELLRTPAGASEFATPWDATG